MIKSPADILKATSHILHRNVELIFKSRRRIYVYSIHQFPVRTQFPFHIK